MAYLTTSEAAEILGVKRRRINDMINRGELQAERFGNAWMIKKSSVEKAKKRPAVGRPPAKR